jgi:hypothetical protein
MVFKKQVAVLHRAEGNGEVEFKGDEGRPQHGRLASCIIKRLLQRA